jgi:hypothetical protein
VFGSSDITVFLESIPFGFGVGEMSAGFAAELEKAVAGSGLDWATDWAPYVLGGFITVDDVQAYEVNYAFANESECATVPTVGGFATPLAPPVAAPIPDRFYDSPFYYVFEL